MRANLGTYSIMITTHDTLLQAFRRVHHSVREALLIACEELPFEQLSGEATLAAGDTVYAIDRIAERAYLEAITQEIASLVSVVVIGEGLPAGEIVLPLGSQRSDAQWIVITDPIDGTRGLMFQKRPAWVVTGITRNRGSATSLADIEVAVQTELPLVKQYLCDEFWAIRGEGAQGERWNRMAGVSEPLTLQPSTVSEVTHGFGTVCSFFAGGREVLGKIADELSHRLLQGTDLAEARIFEDQYASTAGQLAGLFQGQDRFVIDLRPLLAPWLREHGKPLPHCCHPYDLSAKLIADEAGVVLSNPKGGQLDAPLDTETPVAWVGYANPRLREMIEPVLIDVIRDILG